MLSLSRAIGPLCCALVASAACEEGSGDEIPFARLVAVSVQPAGSARVTSTPEGIDCDREYLGTGSQDTECWNSFDASDRVILDAEVADGWAITRWESSLASSEAAACGTATRCEDMGVTGNSTNNVRLVLQEASNSCPNIAVPPFSSLGLKTEPRPGPATPVPDDPVAWPGTNYLTDGDFAGELVFAGGIPTATGYWAFDQAWSAPSGQQGITAQSGSRMLHFVSSSTDGTATAVGTASEQVQLVDVSALRTRIDAGQVEVEASAFFNRVEAGGCTRIDDAFGIRVSAHNGIPTNVNVDLGNAQDNIPADDNAASWQAGSAVLTLPTGTTHVAVRLFINEGAANNDPAYPEFHGHYADNANLTVRLR